VRSRLIGTVIAATATTGLSLTGLVSPVAMVSTAEPDGLSVAIDRLLDDPRLEGAMASVVVRDAATGDTLYERNPDQRLNPASNAKLFTSAAAMETLGSDFRYTTEVLTDARTAGDSLKGDLYLRGSGDPTMLAEHYAHLAAQVKAAGITEIKGDVIADDNYFDEVPLGRGWAWDDEPYYYSAATSALTVAPNEDYDSGTVIVQSGPGAAVGEPARIGLVPQTGAVEIVNRATTAAAGSDNTISIERQHASDRVLVTGSVPLDDETSLEWVTVADPTTYAVDVFRRALEAEGIAVKGRTVPEGSTPEGSRVLASHESMTLAELLIPFMKLSNNMHAEALVKTMGAEAGGEGSWPAGLDVVERYLTGRGIDVDDLRISDGSGLSRFDIVSTDDISDMLVGVRDEPWFDGWYASLPVAGVPERFVGGTLRNRMRNTAASGNLRGKTGSLTSVTALSGYVTNADGRELTFSMVSNNYLTSPRSIEDALGVTLASWSEESDESGDAATVSPRTLRQRTDYGPAGVECSWVKAC
jgi:serine-type D-Ala-D-Ala carboxypeptidase/endopeptidase (penicillin-binding protein 4)